MTRRHFITVVLATLLASCSVFAQDSKAALQDRLASEFKLSKTTDQRDDIVTPGSILVLHKDGLIMFTIASRVPAPDTYKNGKLGISFGDAMGSTLLLGGNQTSSNVPQRRFVSGEKFWLTGTQVTDKQIVLQVISDPYGDMRYYGQIKFPFDKKNIPSPDDMMKTISEVVTAEPPDNPNASDSNSQPSQPAGEQQGPPKSIEVGQTTEQVIAILGQPQKKVNLGAKQIFIYSDMKVTFMDGKVSDVQ